MRLKINVRPHEMIKSLAASDIPLRKMKKL